MALFALILDVVELVESKSSEVKWYTASRFDN
jgi:hypothetical protein